MTVTLIVAVAGVVLIGVLGYLGSRRPARDLEDWTVGGRRFGAVTVWFLQAGEVFTTFTFLGTAGLTFVAVGASAYAIPYVPLALAALYFLGPRAWRLGKDRGYLTQADFLGDRMASRTLEVISALIGIIALLPYLQLQMTGLGLIVELVTGSAANRVLSILLAFAITVVFVLRSGVRGVATAAYFKDVIMLVMLLVVTIAVPLHFGTGYASASHEIALSLPETLRVPFGEYNHAWFFSSMLVSTLGSAFLTLPHQWPALLSARSESALRRNYLFMPIYNLFAAIPMIIALVGVVSLHGASDSNAVLLRLSTESLAPWALGLLLVAAAATAMVPAAAISIAISSLVAHNLVRVRTEARRRLVNRVAVVVVITGAMLLSVLRPDLLANLLLLTFSGLTQLAPAVCLALARRQPVRPPAVIAGMVIGEAVVIALTFGSIPLAGTDTGLVGLAANLLAVAVIEPIDRLRRHRRPSEPAAPQMAPGTGGS